MNDARFWKAHEQHFTHPDEYDDDGVECRDCSGEGKEGGKCVACDGVGKVETGVVTTGGAKEIAECEDCGGTGLYEDDCSNCEGTGRISTAQHRRELREARADYEYETRRDKKLMGE